MGLFDDDIRQRKLLYSSKEDNQSLFLQQCDPFNQNAQCGPKVCRDKLPPGQSSCAEYVKLGMCTIDGFDTEGYCRKSCNKCCEDVVVPGVYNCLEVHKKNMCNMDIVMQSGYCAQTCGYCQTQGEDGQQKVTFPDKSSPAVDCKSPESLECDVKVLLDLKDMSSVWAQSLLHTWKPDSNPCEDGWTGVTCTTIDGEFKRVNSIQLGKYSWNITEYGKRQLTNNWQNWVDHLDCPIPTNLNKMAFLEIISLQRTGLRGPIPYIFDLPRLKVVDLHFNFLDGKIPQQLSLLKNLQVLDLSLNWLAGTIPQFFSTYTNLERLDLWDNKLTGTLSPEFSTLQNLDWININKNKLRGTIPEEYSVWKNLQWFFGSPQAGKQLCIPQSLINAWNLDDAQTNTYELPLCQ